jgi:hypothetical protein
VRKRGGKLPRRWGHIRRSGTSRPDDPFLGGVFSHIGMASNHCPKHPARKLKIEWTAELRSKRKSLYDLPPKQVK